jgi:TolB-like protein
VCAFVNSAPTPTPVRFATFELDLRSGELRKAGLRIKLQRQPLQVLKLLVETPGEVVTRERLRQQLWPADTYVDFDRGLNKAMVRLRDALGDSAESPRFIETLPRRGYRLIVPLKEDSPARPKERPSLVCGQASIAILPFVFLNSPDEAGALSLGFADALITTLGNLENLIVLPTAAILRYAGGRDPAQAGHELGVRYILQGNIQQAGPQRRVSIQVFDTESNKIAFTEKYDFRLETVFEVQDQMAARVAEVLKLRFRSATPRSRDRYSADPSAYEELMQGMRNSSSDDPIVRERTIEQLTSAIARDPRFALAHAVLSCVCAVKHFESDSSPQWLERAEHHCQRALELDPDLAEGHLARAYILWSPARNFAHREAIDELRLALMLQPNVQHAHNRLGTICCHIGRLEEAKAFYQIGRRLQPHHHGGHGIAYAYLFGGEYDEAIREFDMWLRESPGHIYPLYYRPLCALLCGDLDSTAAWLQDAKQRLADDPLVTTLQGLLHAFRGEAEPALDCIRRACGAARSFGHSHHTYYQVAGIYALLGDAQQAMAWLERSVNTGFACWPFFERDQALANLRPREEFQALVAVLKDKFSSIRLPAA